MVGNTKKRNGLTRLEVLFEQSRDLDHPLPRSSPRLPPEPPALATPSEMAAATVVQAQEQGSPVFVLHPDPPALATPSKMAAATMVQAQEQGSDGSLSSQKTVLYSPLRASRTPRVFEPTALPHSDISTLSDIHRLALLDEPLGSSASFSTLWHPSDAPGGRSPQGKHDVSPGTSSHQHSQHQGLLGSIVELDENAFAYASGDEREREGLDTSEQTVPVFPHLADGTIDESEGGGSRAGGEGKDGAAVWPREPVAAAGPPGWGVKEPPKGPMHNTKLRGLHLDLAEPMQAAEPQIGVAGNEDVQYSLVWKDDGKLTTHIRVNQKFAIGSKGMYNPEDVGQAYPPADAVLDETGDNLLELGFLGKGAGTLGVIKAMHLPSMKVRLGWGCDIRPSPRETRDMGL